MASMSTSALVRPGRTASLRSVIVDYLSLTKPEVNFLIVIATFAGFYPGYLGDLHNFPFGRLVSTLVGTLLVASGTGTLNQVLEHRFDAQMRRTCRRPVAAGRVRPVTAAWFGISLSLVGGVYLFVAVNALTSALALFTLMSYLLVYTPLKRKTPLCTFVGAFPGAMPPLIGWAAASGSIASANAWILYAVLFFWQFPHFMAIAWMYREDYDRAGYLVLPTNHESAFLAWFTLVPTVALIITSMAAGGGVFQSSATLLLGLVVFYYALWQIRLRSRIAARQLLRATIVFLPLELLVLMLGRA